MESWVQLGDGRIFVETDGKGPTAIVVPVAWGASHDLYQSLLGELELGLELVYFDAEGTGQSTGLTPDWSAARIVDEIEAVRTEAVNDSVILLGHASGAYLALAYALDHPEAVCALILVSPFAGYGRANDMSVARVESHPQWDAFQQRVREIRRVSMSRADRFRAIFKEQRVIDMYEYGIHYFQMADAADETDFNPVMHDDTETDLIDELKFIEAPTLIVTGEDDPLSPLEEARLIAGEMTQVRLVELPRCGHYPFVEEPDRFETAVQKFLGDIDLIVRR